MKIKRLLDITLMIATMLSLTGCVTSMSENTIWEGPVTEVQVVKPEEIDTEVNREEKEALYSDLLNIPEFCLYGNTFELLVEGETDEDNQYAYSMIDENVSVSIAKPIEKTAEREIRLTVYKFKEDNGMVKMYNEIEIIENNVMKSICLAPEAKATNKIENSKEAESFVKLLNSLPTMKDVEIEYVHTNTEGIDTLTVTNGSTTILIRVNPETGEVHLFMTIPADGKKQIASFTYTDPTTVQKPVNYTESKFDIWYYTKKYVVNIDK